MNAPTTVYNLFHLYHDGDDYLAQSFIGTYATHDAAASSADASTEGRTELPRHTHTAPQDSILYTYVEQLERDHYAATYSARQFVILPTTVRGA